MTESKKYWRERAERIMAIEAKKDDEVIEEVRKITSSTMSHLANEIYSFYAKYANAEGITVDEAKKKIQKTDIREFEDRVAQYVKNKDFSEKANAELRQYNTKMYVSRERMLLQQLSVIMANGTALTEVELEKYLTESVDREVERQSGILGQSVRIKPNHVRAIVNADFYGQEWSERLWGNMDETRKQVLKTVQNSLLRGRHPNEFVPELKKKMGVSTSDAKRLLITETSRVQSEAQKLHYQATMDGDSEIEFVAKLDHKTSDECRHHNGNRVKVKNIIVGVNVPPLHAHCRSTTIPAKRNWRDEFFKEREGRYNLDDFELIDDEDEEDDVIDLGMDWDDDEPDELHFNDNLSEALGEEQTAELKRKLEYNKDAEGAQEYRRIWNHFADEMVIEQPNRRRGAHFNPLNEKVVMSTSNLGERDVLGIGNNKREGDDGYSTVIHEFSHMIDHAVHRDLKGSKNMLSGAFSADPTNYEADEKGNVETLAEVIKKELDAKAKAELKVLKDAHKNGDTETWNHAYKPRLNNGRTVMVRKLREQYHQGHSSGLSDMIEGATNGSFNIAYGHGKSYWKKHPAYKTPLQANLEAFAEMSEAFMDENKREIYEKELPKSYALYIQMLKIIVERLGL
ncbi:minor capsid protein [Staphylococcus xylosus]|uniref:minor capsid protein n=1 Tax=Staphylococcus xylosus TaxID=1288 RepID=UPI0009BCCB1A|nr:minor capsid protein [Staphylococcus xylosus]